ncbi:hypothetical protein AX16_010724 [Volvariella volvacea WC 439]|nr:hypothetical protein AX16_010724 [Volvariella volvacea WC 439]
MSLLRQRLLGLWQSSSEHDDLPPPIYKLPPELLSAIFIAYAQLNRQGSNAFIWELSRVCMLWWFVIQKTPQLWTNIDAHLGLPFYHPMIRTFLIRSGGCSLSIHLTVTSVNQCKTDLFRQIIWSASRWRHVHLELAPSTVPFFGRLRRHNARLEEVQIKIITPKGRWGRVLPIIPISSFNALTDAPSLRHVSLHWEIPTSRTPLPWSTLSCFRGKFESVDQTISLLSSAYMLQILDLSDCARFDVSTRAPPPPTPEEELSRPKFIYLPYLHTLHFRGVPPYEERPLRIPLTSQIISILELPSLTHATFNRNSFAQIRDMIERSACDIIKLKLEHYCYEQNNLYQILSLTPNLEELALDHPNESDYNMLVIHYPPNPSPPDQIDNLILDQILTQNPTHDTDDDDGSDPSRQHNQSPPPNFLGNVCTNLRRLEFNRANPYMRYFAVPIKNSRMVREGDSEERKREKKLEELVINVAFLTRRERPRGFWGWMEIVFLLGIVYIANFGASGFPRVWNIVPAFLSALRSAPS